MQDNKSMVNPRTYPFNLVAFEYISIHVYGNDRSSQVVNHSRTSLQVWVGPYYRNDDHIFARLRQRAASLLKVIQENFDLD